MPLDFCVNFQLFPLRKHLKKGHKRTESHNDGEGPFATFRIIIDDDDDDDAWKCNSTPFFSRVMKRSHPSSAFSLPRKFLGNEPRTKWLGAISPSLSLSLLVSSFRDKDPIHNFSCHSFPLFSTMTRERECHINLWSAKSIVKKSHRMGEGKGINKAKEKKERKNQTQNPPHPHPTLIPSSWKSYCHQWMRLWFFFLHSLLFLLGG